MRPVSLLLIPLLVALAGCSLSQDAFVEDFVAADCVYLLDCLSEPEISFNGWDSPEACQADRGPEVAADGVGCVYDNKAARACVDAVEEQTCAADGEERAFPPICNDVFVLCSGDDTDTDADTDSGTEAAE